VRSGRLQPAFISDGRVSQMNAGWGVAPGRMNRRSPVADVRDPGTQVPELC